MKFKCRNNKDIVDIINKTCQSPKYYIDCVNNDDEYDELIKMVNANEDCHEIEQLFESDDFIVIKTIPENEIVSYIKYEVEDDYVYIAFSCTTRFENVKQNETEKLRKYFRKALIDNVIEDGEFLEEEVDFTDDEVDEYILKHIYNGKVNIVNDIHRGKDLSTILRVFIIMLAMKYNIKNVISYAISPFSKKALKKLGFKEDEIEKIDINHNMVMRITDKVYNDTVNKLKQLKLCKK